MGVSRVYGTFLFFNLNDISVRSSSVVRKDGSYILVRVAVTGCSVVCYPGANVQDLLLPR
jgi:hypothetical protein